MSTKCTNLINKAEREKSGSKKEQYLYDAIRCLSEQLSDESKRNEQRLSETLTTPLQKTSEVASNIKKYLSDLDEQYKLGESIAKVQKEIGINIGLSVGQSENLNKSLKRSYLEISQFGGEIEHVEKLMKSLSNESGRVKFATTEDTKLYTELSKIVGEYGTGLGNVIDNLNLMGISSQKASDIINKMVYDSSKMGLNSKKVLETLTNNLDKMQTYSFSNGIKGMTEMAKQAVKMRVTVDDVLQMADKFYQPEAAIEAAAELQLLGGDIAAAFGDPFTVMYEARNKPEELAKRVQQMTENMIQFNEESGEYELPAEAKMQFDALAKTIGIGSSELIKMSKESAKLKDVKLGLSGSMFSEEEMETIANFTRMEDGQLKVDIPGLDPKNIEDLQQTDLDLLVKLPEDEKDYMNKMIYESQLSNDRLQNIENSIKAGAISEFDPYLLLEKFSEPAIRGLQDFGKTAAKEMKELLEKGGFDELKNKLGMIPEDIGKGIEDTFSVLESLIKGEMGNVFDLKDKPFDDIMLSAKQVNITAGGMGSVNVSQQVEGNNKKNENNPNPSGKENGDFLSRNDGSVTSFSSMDDIIGAKSGGPIDKLLNSVLNNNNNSGVVEVKGNPKIDININSNNPNMNFTTEQMDQITSVALTSILSVFNNGGAPDGGSQSQNAKGFEQKLGKFG